MQSLLSVGGKSLRSIRTGRSFSSSPSSSSSSSSKDLPSYLLNTAPYKLTTLNNQMRVASEQTHGEIATIGVWIDAGSVYENAENNGVAHFLEHMAFKGTDRRSRQQLEMEIEDMGGSLNAHTSREHTFFQMKVFKNDVPKAMDILSDILLKSKYDHNDIERERGTILREHEEVSKDTAEVIFDHLHAAAFQGTPLARPILGSRDNIKNIKREDLTNFVKTHYTGNRIIVVGAGAVQHDQLVDLSSKHFGTLPSTSNLTPNPNDASAKVTTSKIPTKTPFTGCHVDVRDDAMELVHFVIAVQGIPASHPDYFAFLVLQNMIGSWDRNVGGGKNLSSRLCEIVGTEELAHSITSFNTTYRDTGLFGVYGVADSDKTEDLGFEIIYDWVRIAKTVTNLEVDRAKARLKSSLLMGVDGTSAIVEDIGRQLLTHGRRMTPAEIFLRINAVTATDISRIAMEHCFDTEPALVSMGNTKGFPEYHRIRGWTYWNRW